MYCHCERAEQLIDKRLGKCKACIALKTILTNSANSQKKKELLRKEFKLFYQQQTP